jgi:hypothetical protein
MFLTYSVSCLHLTGLGYDEWAVFPGVTVR